MVFYGSLLTPGSKSAVFTVRVDFRAFSAIRVKLRQRHVMFYMPHVTHRVYSHVHWTFISNMKYVSQLKSVSVS